MTCGRKRLVFFLWVTASLNSPIIIDVPVVARLRVVAISRVHAVPAVAVILASLLFCAACVCYLVCREAVPVKTLQIT